MLLKRLRCTLCSKAPAIEHFNVTGGLIVVTVDTNNRTTIRIANNNKLTLRIFP